MLDRRKTRRAVIRLIKDHEGLPIRKRIQLRAALYLPGAMWGIEEILGDEGLPEEIDWDKLLEFIKELMPIILEFIEMLMLLF